MSDQGFIKETVYKDDGRYLIYYSIDKKNEVKAPSEEVIKYTGEIDKNVGT